MINSTVYGIRKIQLNNEHNQLDRKDGPLLKTCCIARITYKSVGCEIILPVQFSIKKKW